VIGAIVEENGWDPTDPKDLDKGYGLAMGTGKIKAWWEPWTYRLYGASPHDCTRPSSQPNTSESEKQFYQEAPLGTCGIHRKEARTAEVKDGRRNKASPDMLNGASEIEKKR